MAVRIIPIISSATTDAGTQSECQPYIALDEDLLLSCIRPASTHPHKRKPQWGASVPHNSYMQTPHALAILGHILPKTRLAADAINRKATFHPSILYSPRPSAAARSKHEQAKAEKQAHERHIFDELQKWGLDRQALRDLGFPLDEHLEPHLPRVDSAWDPRRRAELQGGAPEEEVWDVYKAMGKHMITLDDVREKFGRWWKPKFVKLNPLEIKAREMWMRSSIVPVSVSVIAI